MIVRRGARAPRFADPRPREWWGYWVWGVITLVVVVPEIIAGVDEHAPWPTISVTVAELEYEASWVALLVVALIVFVAWSLLRYPSTPGAVVTLATGREIGRTPQGRLTIRPREADAVAIEISVAYLAAGVLVVAAASVLAAVLPRSDVFVIGYVLYGSIAVLFVVIPSVAAFWFAQDVPYPTFFRTLAYLERRLPALTLLILIGLVILALHLTFFPWPTIFHQLQPQPPDPGAP